jgi:hypothetical protein
VAEEPAEPRPIGAAEQIGAAADAGTGGVCVGQPVDLVQARRGVERRTGDRGNAGPDQPHRRRRQLQLRAGGVGGSERFDDAGVDGHVLAAVPVDQIDAPAGSVPLAAVAAHGSDEGRLGEHPADQPAGAVVVTAGAVMTGTGSERVGQEHRRVQLRGDAAGTVPERAQMLVPDRVDVADERVGGCPVVVVPHRPGRNRRRRAGRRGRCRRQQDGDEQSDDLRHPAEDVVRGRRHSLTVRPRPTLRPLTDAARALTLTMGGWPAQCGFSSRGGAESSRPCHTPQPRGD